MSCLSSRWTGGICQVCHRGKSIWVIAAYLGWNKRGWRFGCQSRKCNYLHGIRTVLLLTERILDQARGASVPLHLLAWARGALSRHRTAGLYTESESLDASRCRPCGGSLQVKWQPNQNIQPSLNVRTCPSITALDACLLVMGLLEWCLSNHLILSCAGLKVTVRPKLKFHPFATHSFVDGGSVYMI